MEKLLNSTMDKSLTNKKKTKSPGMFDVQETKLSATQDSRIKDTTGENESQLTTERKQIINKFIKPVHLSAVRLNTEYDGAYNDQGFPDILDKQNIGNHSP